MSDHQFDDQVRVIATSPNRRSFVRGLLAGGLGAASGLATVADAATARCRPKSARCASSDQCCSNRCRRGFCYPRRS